MVLFIRSVLEILWARRAVVIVAFAFALAGGAAVVLVSAPRYQASAKVILDYIKPDPITGAYVNNKMVEAYVKTEMRSIRDFQVGIAAAEALGLLNDIELQSRYAMLPGANAADFPAWVAQGIIASTGVRMLPETNIIEITFTTGSPEAAQHYAEALRDAYVSASIDSKRSSAAAGADNLERQAKLEGEALAKLEGAKRELQDVHGVMPAMEAARLSELVNALRPLYVERAPSVPSAGKLAEVDAMLEQASRTLGPNHPRLEALRVQRNLVAQQVERERAEAAAVGQGAVQVERARQAEIERQKDRVLSQRELALELRLIDEEIQRRRDTLTSFNTRIANLRQLTALQRVNLIPLGEVRVRSKPVFPDPVLILGGVGFLGLTFGSMLALFIEFLNRRVRRPQHLMEAVGAPLLGVMPYAKVSLRRLDREAKAAPIQRILRRKAAA